MSVSSSFSVIRASLFCWALCQVLGSLEIAAAVLLVGIKEGVEEIVAKVIVMLGDGAGARSGLEIENHSGHITDDIAEVEAQLRIMLAAQDAVEHLVDLLTVPPAIHVGLAHAQALVPDYARVPAVIIDLDVPGIRSIQIKTGGFRNLSNCLVHDENRPLFRGNPEVEVFK